MAVFHPQATEHPTVTDSTWTKVSSETGRKRKYLMLQNEHGMQNYRIEFANATPDERVIAFNSGSEEIEVGDELTGATGGATATVVDIVVATGTWAGGDAAGYIYLTDQTGTFEAENLNIGATTNVATIGGDSTVCAGFLLAAGDTFFWDFDGVPKSDVYAFQDSGGSLASLAIQEGV